MHMVPNVTVIFCLSEIFLLLENLDTRCLRYVPSRIMCRFGNFYQRGCNIEIFFYFLFS